MDRIPFDPYDFFGYLASGLLAIVGMELVLGFPQVLGRDLKVVDGALLVLCIYVVGQILAMPSKAILEDFLVETVLQPPSTTLLAEKKPKILGFLFSDYCEPLKEPMRSKVLKKAKDGGVPETGEALFLYVRYKKEMTDDANLMANLGAFLNQYGFNRNLCFTSLLFGVALTVKGQVAGNVEFMQYGLAGVVCSVLLFYRFLKFYRHYSLVLFCSYAGRD